MIRDGYTITDCADYYDFSHGKWNSRSGNSIRRIVPHHMAGNLSPETFYNIMHGGRQMSPTVSVHTDGTVWAWVPEECRPWTTGSWEADCCALTLEIANDGGAETGWHVSDAAYNTAVQIMAEWCLRYDIDPVYTYRGSGINMHRDWDATACPGDYLYDKIVSGQMERDIKAIMYPQPEPAPEPEPSDVQYKVQCGAFKVKKNAENLKAKLNADGFNCWIKADGEWYRCQCGSFRKKENAEGLVNQLKNKGYKPIIKTEK